VAQCNVLEERPGDRFPRQTNEFQEEEKEIMRTGWVWKTMTAALVLLVAVAMGAAASGGGDTTAGKVATTIKAGTTVNIYADAGTSAKPWEDFKDDIEKESGIKINMTWVTQADIYTKLMAEIASGGGSFDLVEYQPAQLPEFVRLGYLRSMDELLGVRDPKLDDIIGPFRQLYTVYNGKLYALPFDGDLHVYFYRKDLVDNPAEKEAFKAKYGRELQPPTTWDEQKEFAQFFTRKKGTLLAGKPLANDFYGVGMLTGRGWVHYEFLNHFAGRGGVYFDSNMKPMINSPAGIAALQDLKDMIPYAPPGVLSWGFTEDRGAMASGTTASLVIWQDVFKSTYAEVKKLGGQIAAAPMPGAIVDGKLQTKAAMPFGRILSVTAKSKCPAEAFWVASYMSDFASQEFVFDPETGEDPFRYSHINAPDKLAQKLTNFTKVPMTTAEATDFLSVVKKNLENGYPELNISGAAQYTDVLDLHLSKALSGEMTVKAAMDTVAAEWDKITKSLGFDQQKQMWLGTFAEWKKLGYVK
jgi:multiple sugar transport system substrate-binding protein